MLPCVIVVVCSSLLEAWELSTAEELATEEEAVIGEFSVVLSVGMPMLELVKVNVVEKYTVELDSSGASELVTTSLLSELGTGAEELAEGPGLVNVRVVVAEPPPDVGKVRVNVSGPSDEDDEVWETSVLTVEDSPGPSELVTTSLL